MKTTFYTLLFLALSTTATSIAQGNVDERFAHHVMVNENPYNGSSVPERTYDVDSMSMIFQERIQSIDQAALIDLFPQRPFYNRSFKVSTGMSMNTYRVASTMNHYSDTSEQHSFTINGHSPVFAFSQQFALDSTFSLGYTMGYSQSDVLFDNSYYGTKRYFLSLSPALNIYRSYNWEYYMELNIGLIYHDNNLDEIPNEVLQRIFPTKFKMFTGVTIAGINYFITDHLAMNTEISIWGHETINFGLSYRFFNESGKASCPKFTPTGMGF